MKIMFAHRSSQTYTTFPYHNHQYWEVIVGLTGSGTALIDGEQYAFDERTILCIPPGVPHRKTAVEGYTDGNIFFTDFTPLGGSRPYVFQDDAIGSFRNVFNMAYNIYLLEEANSKGLMDALAELLNQLILTRTSSGQNINKAVEIFQQTLIQNIQNEEFDLSSAEDDTGYSRSYFRKLFKAYTGLSPSGYLQKLRIDFAKRQLRQFQKSMAIHEVAALSGFVDPDYFSRVFRKKEGISPREYIESLGETTFEIPKISDTTPEMRNVLTNIQDA